MAQPLKTRNNLGLYTLMVANLVLFYALVKSEAILVGEWTSFFRDTSYVFPAGVGIVLTGILNAQLSPDMKSRIVFVKWKNPLPGFEAFTRHAESDPRVDVSSLERLHGPLPVKPADQNRLWYRLYRTVESEPAVIQAHQSFLFSRDYTCLSLMMLGLLGVSGFFQIPSTRIFIMYLVLLGTQFLLAGQAARNHGKRFVTTVLAIKSAE